MGFNKSEKCVIFIYDAGELFMEEPTLKSNTKTNSLRGILLAGTIISGMVFAAPAMAQEEKKEGETVVITGTRIVKKDYTSASPITTIGAAQIEASGSLTTEKILNTLPQVVASFTAASNNPSDGTATADLRGIGASRTLVLVNGHRMTPATKASSAIDLNTIPVGLIRKVEVVTGGASATYGSDGLAGVVNFILKDDFNGLEFSGQTGGTEVGDGKNYNASVIFGTNFADDKGNITTYASYYKRDAVLSSERDWAYYSNAGGSGTGVAGRADNVPLNPFAPLATAPGCTSNATRRDISFGANGVARGYCNNFDMTAAVNDRYNFSPVNNLMSPGKRISTAVFGKYNFAENLTGRLEIFYTDNKQSSQLAPTPMTGLSVSATNPFISPSFAAALAGRANPTANFVFRKRMEQVGPRVQDHNNKQFQFVTGLKGTTKSGFNWDVSANWGRTEFTDTTFNDVSKSRMYAATQGTAQGATTTSCSAAVLAIFPSCKPFNLFGANSASQAAVDFVRLNFTDVTTFERAVLNANIGGDLFNLPAGAVSFNIGTEYRKDDFAFSPDAAHGSGDIFGFNAEKPVNGGFDVMEFFGEVSIPLLAKMPMAEEVNLELGARSSDYSSIGGTEAYKAGLEWKFNKDLRFRAMYQKASRAPSAFELYQAGDQGFPQFTDPCSTVNVNTGDPITLTAAVRAFCTTTMGFDPVTAGYIQPNSQIESFNYGNPDLQEETTDTKTFGFVWRPSFVNSLSMTLDYYDIDVSNYIGTLNGGAAGTVAACFATLNMTSSACFNSAINKPSIYRDITGELKVNTSLGNVSALQTKGIDFTAEYAIPLGWLVKDSTLFDNKLNFGLIMNYLDTWVLDGIDYAGTAGAYNISITLPKYKATMNMGYKIGDVKLALNTTYYHKLDNQGNIPDFQDGGYIGTDAYWLTDAQARWAVNKSTDLVFGINNIMDKEPPVFDNSPDGNTDPNSFDVLGRSYYMGFKLKF